MVRSIIFGAAQLMNIKNMFRSISAGAYWKERTIAVFMVSVYLLGNIVELIEGKVTDDPAAIWIAGVLLGISVVWLSATKNYKGYTATAFKIFLFYLNFNVIYAYSKSTQGPTDAESFYLLFSYFLFVVCSQALDSQRELLIFSIAEVGLVAVAMYINQQYDPMLLQSMQLFTFGFIIVGNYMINLQRLKLTQATVGSSINVQFKSISENSRDTQVILNNQSKFVYANPSVKLLTGYDVGQLMNTDLFALVIDEDVDRLKDVLERVRVNDERVSFEYRLRRQNGELVWVESIFSSFDIRVEDGGAGLIFAETRNVESRKKLEEEVKHQLKVEEMLIKHSTQFINVERGEIQSGIDVALGEFGTMLGAQAALVYRMHGKLSDEFQSTNQWFASNQIAHIQNFELIVKINQQLLTFLRQLRGEKSSWGNYIEAQKLHDIQVMSTVDASDKNYYLIPLQSGNIVNGFIVFVFNLNTKHVQSSFFGLIGNMVANAFTRLRTETRLHEVQLTNEFILRALPDWLYIVDNEGEFTGANNYSTLEAYIPDYDLIGKKFNQLMPDDVSSVFMATLKEVIESGQSTSFEYHDSTIYKGRYFKVIIAPFKDFEYLVIIRDVTDLKEAQSELMTKAEKLEQSNKELEEFAYVVSHDMKQPIRTIISYLSLLKRKYEKALDEEANVFINFSIDGANKMSDLIRDILQYSRVEQQIDVVKDVPLNTVVGKVIAILGDTIKTNNAAVIVDELPHVNGNDTMLSELFQNLIENGIKYNRNPDKRVRVIVKEAGDFWQFEVSDNGIGFDEEYAQQIFKIFKRLHNDEEFPGTGIGLSICHKVVTKHGGKIWAKSVKGEGSHFYFTLPKQTQATLN